jgi:hypothetical protein
MQNFMAMILELAEGMTDERLATCIAELESGKKLRVSDPEGPTGRLNVGPIILQVFKQVQESRKKKPTSTARQPKKPRPSRGRS